MGAGVLAIIGTAPAFGQLSPQKPDLLGRDELPGFVYWNRYSDTQKRDCIKQGGISPEGLFDPMRYPSLNLRPEPKEGDQAQSPIALSTTRKVSSALPNIKFEYQPSVTSGAELTLKNNGHTVELALDPEEYKPGHPGRVGTGITEEPPARKIVLNGTSYTLDNLHFHTPSEHVVDDKPFDMELHVVHAALPQRAVIAIFLKVGDRENTALKPLFDAMSNLKNEGQKTKVTFGSDKLAAIFPADMTYFGYAGSLTTPPCDYGVTWMVLKTPIQISKEQLAQFKAALMYGRAPGKGFPDNARNVQFPGYHAVSPTYSKN
jgi:carbonic anhydrase